MKISAFYEGHEFYECPINLISGGEIICLPFIGNKCRLCGLIVNRDFNHFYPSVDLTCNERVIKNIIE